MISLLTCGIKLLEEAGIEGAKLDAEVLLAHTLNISRCDIYLFRNKSIDELSLSFPQRNGRNDNLETVFFQCIERRKNHCPIAYITGLKEFWSLSIRVNEHVLIPRPETELVVEEALKVAPKKILDLCTGSGCIAAALAKELPNARIYVSDISEEALDVARKNLIFAEDRVKFILSNLFENISDSEKFDVITANPPYIALGDKQTLSPEIAYEPESALFGGKSGLDFTTKIINDAHRFIKRGGQLIMEIGINQSAALTEIAQSLGRYSLIETKKDLAGIDRVWKSYL